jgi:outer membrane biosynthesis protein TonB
VQPRTRISCLKTHAISSYKPEMPRDNPLKRRTAPKKAATSRSQKAEPKTKQKPKPKPKPKPKAKKVSAKAKRAPTKPPRSTECGLNIGVARAKTILDDNSLNQARTAALKEINQFIEQGRSRDELSPETKASVEAAIKQHHDLLRDEWDRGVVLALTKGKKKEFLDARRVAKSEFDRQARDAFSDDTDVFDVAAFNQAQIKKFYEGFSPSIPAPDESKQETELHVLARLVSKWKTRFAANAKVIYTAFTEQIVRQLATNGIYSCVTDNKKIVTVRNAVDFTKEGTKSRFPLYPMVQNLSTYRKHLVNVTKLEDVCREGNAHKAKLSASVQNLFMFVEGEEEESKQKNFNLYVGECFKAVKAEMAEADGPFGHLDAETRGNFLQTSISRPLRDFCSAAITEILQILSAMLQTELHDKNVKTVTNRMLRTAIQHMHTMSGVSYEATQAFIRDVSTKYMTFVLDRREEKKKKHEEAKEAKKPEEPEEAEEAEEPDDIDTDGDYEEDN